MMRVQLALALIAAALVPTAMGQGSTADEIAKYREALQQGNPAELWEARGEDLWKQKRGPRDASLERCDLGQGPGVVKGAYAHLPKYFADAGKVMDVEQRLRGHDALRNLSSRFALWIAGSTPAITTL